MSKRCFPWSPAVEPGRGRLRQITDLRGVHKNLYQLAVGSFKWTGLPYGLPSYMMERFLFDAGCVAAFVDNVGGLMILPAYEAGRQSKYYIPQQYTVFGMGYYKNISIGDAVIGWNDSAHSSSWETVEGYAQTINEINIADQMNIKQLRFPWIFSGDEQTVNSLKAALTTVEQNTFALFTTDSIRKKLTDGVGFQTGVKYLGDDLKKHRDDIYNECLTLLGFDNTPVEKRERLTDDEVHSNDQQVNYFRRDRLERRREFADAVNKKFGSSISVEWAGGDVERLVGGGNDV